MDSAATADAARESLGPVGTYLPIPFTAAPTVGLQREAVARLERAGYRATWTNETVGGRDIPWCSWRCCWVPPSG
jgi:hypothetical protein